jgi:hypothetical protein
VTMASAFTDANALSSLLTVESLLFASLSVTVSISGRQRRVPDLPLKPSTLGYLAFALLSLVALGALMAWANIFLDPAPSSFRRWVIAAGLAAAIVAQPALAWAIARGLRNKA